ncbi:MAG TPA: integrase core domain-containing protein, partial [Phycisphaerae bacterium]|nr:integrase core domain-containing protein [Phycisphaerae bacterium]
SRRFNWAGLPLIATVARLLCRELTLQNEYLRLENRVLKSKVKGRLRFTDDERRSLVAAALAMGRKLMRRVVGIVKPETILAWQRRLEQRKWDYSERRQRGPGRPRTPGEVEALVCRLARENTWGYKRICGELKKLGIEVSKSCISDILRRNGLPPSPERKGLTWREFLARQADVLLCADLFTKEIWTFCGLRRAFVLVVMHLKSRTILLAEATFSPHGGWMAQQVRNMLMGCDDLDIRPRFLLHDRDTSLCADFDAVLRSAGVEPVKTPYRAPNANPFIERWGRSLREECLNNLILFGLKSLRRTVALYRRHYNEGRPHQGLANRVPQAVRTGEPAPEPVRGPIGEVHCEESLGGLLKSYRRAA